MTSFLLQILINVKSKLYHIENSKTRGHFEPPHQDLRCLQIQLFSSLVLKELRMAVGGCKLPFGDFRQTL